MEVLWWPSRYRTLGTILSKSYSSRLLCILTLVIIKTFYREKGLAILVHYSCKCYIYSKLRAFNFYCISLLLMKNTVKSLLEAALKYKPPLNRSRTYSYLTWNRIRPQIEAAPLYFGLISLKNAHFSAKTDVFTVFSS